MTLPKAATEKAADLLLAQFDSGLSEAAARWLADPGAARSQIEGAAATWPAARLLTEPPRVVLAGPPNAGKSSLANRLLARPASLVHEMPGTTRDYVAGLGEIGGFAMCVVDTAGLGFGGTDIDRQATQFAHEQIDAADVLLAVFDGAAPLTPTDAELLDMWRPDPRVLAVANKSDLGPPAAWLGRAGGLLATSARTGQGLDELAGRIVRLLGLDRLAPGQPLCFTARQHDLLSAAAGAADSAAAAESLRALLKGG